MALRKQSLPEPEELFLDYVKRMARHRNGREVLLVRMSQLEPINRTRHNVELVTTRLGQVARKFDGQVFRFVNGDVACVMRDASPGHLDSVLFDIRYGFSGDLLVQAEDDGEAVFIERFDVRRDYESVEQLARERLASFNTALDASKAAAEEDLAAEAARTPWISPVAGTGGSPQKMPPKEMASLLDMDRGAGRSRHAPPAGSEAPVVAGPLDRWLADNLVNVGGARLPLVEVVRSFPICEIGHPGQPAAGATLQVSPAWLVDAYARAAGMKMSDRLEGFLLEEAETSLVALLGSLVSPRSGPGKGFGRSLCLSPRVILSATFLLAAREWQNTEQEGAMFWFDQEDFDHDAQPMAYVADFLHDMGHCVGLRGLIPGELGTWTRRFPQVDGWVLKWPDMDLGRAPTGEVNGLSRALEQWGPDHILLQGINSEARATAARAFGFRFAECTDAAAVKLFTRPR